MPLSSSLTLTNVVFRHHYPQIKLLTTRRIALQKEARQLEARQAEIRAELTAVQIQEQENNMHLTTIRPRPFFSRQLPDDVKLSIVGRVGHWGAQKVACVCRDFRATVNKARELRMYGGQGLSISAGDYHTVISTKGRVYTCGGPDPNYADDDEDVLKTNSRAH